MRLNDPVIDKIKSQIAQTMDGMRQRKLYKKLSDYIESRGLYHHPAYKKLVKIYYSVV